jgi:hypothetical protein
MHVPDVAACNACNEARPGAGPTLVGGEPGPVGPGPESRYDLKPLAAEASESESRDPRAAIWHDRIKFRKGEPTRNSAAAAADSEGHFL